jgi:hypothetical protein
VDAFVAGESSGSLDAMFGDLAGAGSQTATQLGQAYPLDWQDCRDPTHERFLLADDFSQLGSQTSNAARTKSASVFTWLFLSATFTLVIQQTTSVNFLAVPSVGSGGSGRPFLNMYEPRTS